VRLALEEPDLIERSVACTWRATLGPGAGDAAALAADGGPAAL